MNKELIYEKLNKIFQDFFDNDSLVISEKTEPSDVPGWDSLAHITLISMIEEEFEINFDMDALETMKTVRDIADNLEALLA